MILGKMTKMLMNTRKLKGGDRLYNVRIRRPEEQEYIYKELTNKKEFGTFETYKDLFMMAMVVGFLEGNRQPFQNTSETINWQVFNASTDEPVINIIAYLETEDFTILYDYTEDSFKEKIKIAEEYAAGGAKLIYDVIMSDQKNGLQKIIDYIQEFDEIKNHSDLKAKRLKEDLNL